MSDLISRQAVLDKAIRIPIAKIVTEDKIIYRRVVFVDEIEQMPSAEPTGDLISRQAVHEAIEKWAGSMSVLIALPTREIRPLLDSIHKLPSVNPQEKMGHWIEHPEIKTFTPEIMFYECSECGDKQCFCKSDIHKKHFCNYCGARMVEPQESEDKK